jgi:hypothetical protein
MLPTKFRFIWPSGCRGEDLKKLANQKQELPVAAMFDNGSGQNEQSESKFDRKHPWKIIYKECSFRSDLLTSMADTGNSCF